MAAPPELAKGQDDAAGHGCRGGRLAASEQSSLPARSPCSAQPAVDRNERQCIRWGSEMFSPSVGRPFGEGRGHVFQLDQICRFHCFRRFACACCRSRACPTCRSAKPACRRGAAGNRAGVEAERGNGSAGAPAPPENGSAACLPLWSRYRGRGGRGLRTCPAVPAAGDGQMPVPLEQSGLDLPLQVSGDDAAAGTVSFPKAPTCRRWSSRAVPGRSCRSRPRCRRGTLRKGR